jgi:phage terminase large subunit
MKLSTRIETAELQAKILKYPEFFVGEYLGDTYEDYQLEIAESVKVNTITSVRSCHDTGKSFSAGRIALNFLMAHTDSIVLTTAPTFRQVEEILWREIRGAHHRAKNRVPIGGRMLKTKLNIDEEWYAIGVSSDDANKIQGFHPKSGYILVIVDEAAGVNEDVFIAVDAIMSSYGARLLMIGNPTSLNGRFYDSHHKMRSVKRIHISCFDTPNFKNNGIKNVQDLMRVDMSKVEITRPHLITPMWAKGMIEQHGVDSPIVQARVFGQFPSAEDNTLIPLNYIELAAEPERRASLKMGAKYIGCDPARYGSDKTVITVRYGNIVEEQIETSKEDVAQTAGRVKLFTNAEGYFIDDIGLGAGVVDILLDDKIENVYGISFSNKANDPQFVNLRAELYWKIAELFKRGEIAIPNDPDLISQLASIRYEITRHGIKIEEKEEIRKRIHRSPDKADSLVLSFADYRISTKLRPSLGKGNRVAPSNRELYNEFENG